MIRRALSTLVICGAVLSARTGYAGDAALAESLFREGRTLMDSGDYAAACPKLGESYRQDPATGTLLALALCQEQAGSTASAWASYSEVITRAKRDGQKEREQAAREHMQALEPKLSHLTVTVDPSIASISGLTVKRDGIPLGQAAWGASAPVDPGEHAVEAAAPGKRPWKVSVKIGGAGDSQSVKVPALQDEPASGSGAAPPSSEGSPPGEGASSGSPLRTIGLVVGGVGVVGLGVSAYFGLHAASLNSDSKASNHCDADNNCDPEGLANRSDAVSASKIATITLVAGGVLAATGVTLFIVGGSGSGGRESASIQATPAVSPSGAAMLVRGRF